MADPADIAELVESTRAHVLAGDARRRGDPHRHVARGVPRRVRAPSLTHSPPFPISRWLPRLIRQGPHTSGSPPGIA